MRGAFVATLVALVMATGVPNSQAEHRIHRGPCDEDRYDVKPAMGHETVHAKVAALIGCAVRRWDVDGGLSKALDVAQCESGLWPWAVGGDNLGVFQHKARYWAGRVHALLRREWFYQLRDGKPDTIPSAFNARANVLVAIRMVHGGGWGPWSCA